MVVVDFETHSFHSVFYALDKEDGFVFLVSELFYSKELSAQS